MSDDNTSGFHEHDGYQYDIVPDFVEQVNQDNTLADQIDLGVKENEGVTDGVDHDIRSTFYICCLIYYWFSLSKGQKVMSRVIHFGITLAMKIYLCYRCCKLCFTDYPS